MKDTEWETDGSYTFVTNRQGFRDRDHTLLPDQNRTRIAIVGDSFIWGLPLNQEDLLPQLVERHLNARGWPVAYQYRVGERVMPLVAEDGVGRPAIVHLKAAHPLDDHYGLGCAGAAAGAVAIHNAATQWNKALLDNAARPSGAATASVRCTS